MFFGAPTFYKIVNDLCFFPHGLVTFSCRGPTHHNLCSSLGQPFARTLFSFIPNTISVWNSLPLDLLSAPNIAIHIQKRFICFSICIITCITLTIGYTLN